MNLLRHVNISALAIEHTTHTQIHKYIEIDINIYQSVFIGFTHFLYTLIRSFSIYIYIYIYTYGIKSISLF